MLKRSLFALVVALATAHASAGEVQGFSFDYQMTGDRSITPYQVFDDGVAMYLQFKDPAKVPSIFVRDGEGSRPITPEAHGQYLRIPALAQRLELLSQDRRTATILSTRKVATAAKTPMVYEAPRQFGRPETAMQGAAPVPVKPVSMAPTPLYARRAVDVAPGAQDAPMASPVSETAQLRHEIEQLRRVLGGISSRIGQGAGQPKHFAPPVYEGQPRVLNVRAEPAPMHMASVGSAPGNGGNGHGCAHAGSSPMAVPIVYAGADRRAYSLKVDAGQRLSDAIRHFVGAQGLELDWDTGGADFEIKFGFAVTGGTIDETLYGVLSQFKLNALTKRGNNVVAVTRAS